MAALLSSLPQPFDASIVVVQHLPFGFTRAFAEFLEGRVRMPVHVVHEEMSAKPGSIFIAPDGRHLTVTSSNRLRPVDAPTVEGHRPSVDVLFQSLAEAVGHRAAGVILSGMGCDGVSGLLAMRRAGGFTIAQSEETCGVFGMPAAALRRGATSRAHSPTDIAAIVGNWTRGYEHGW
jgi:two-component system chemotaxis response regulator CheB